MRNSALSLRREFASPKQVNRGILAKSTNSPADKAHHLQSSGLLSFCFGFGERLLPRNRFGSIHFFPFSPVFSLGTASGEFPRPAASRRLLFRLLPRNLLKPHRRFARVPPEKALLALGVVYTHLWVPQLRRDHDPRTAAFPTILRIWTSAIPSQLMLKPLCDNKLMLPLCDEKAAT
jgi:hypothetical protein